MKKKIIQFIRTAENLENNMFFAMNYAKKSGLGINLLMVLEQRHEYFYPMTSPMGADITTFEFERIIETRLQEEEKNLKDFLDRQSKIPGNPEINYTIETGATDMILKEYSENDDTELIMINEAQEPEDGFIINTFLNILEHSKCPVVKVPEKHKTVVPPKKIMYATDYKEEDIPTLKQIAKTAAMFDSEITALHITDSIDLEEKMMGHGFEASVQEKLGYKKLKLKLQKASDAVSGILNFSKEENFDMIAVLKENRNFFQRVFTRSDSNKILSKSEIPVMVFHENNV